MPIKKVPVPIVSGTSPHNSLLTFPCFKSPMINHHLQIDEGLWLPHYHPREYNSGICKRVIY